jgi:hypothetical protein
MLHEDFPDSESKNGEAVNDSDQVPPSNVGSVALHGFSQERRPNSFTDPVGFVHSFDPEKARQMRQRSDNLVRQRELSSVDERLRDFRF